MSIRTVQFITQLTAQLGFTLGLFAGCASVHSVRAPASSLSRLQELGQARAYVSFSRHGRAVDIATSTFPIRVEVLKDDLVKIRFATAPDFATEYTWSVDPAAHWPDTDFSVEDLGKQILIRAAKIQVVVGKGSPASVSVLDGRGQPLLEDQGQFADGAQDFNNHLPNGSPQNRIILGARFRMNPTEHFYGLGEKVRGPFDQSLDWRGRKRDPGLDISTMGNRFEGADGGANGNLMVPFLLSTLGYGFFLDTAYKTYWEFDSPAQDSWYVKQDCDQDWVRGEAFCRKSEMRYYVMAADTAAGAIERYTEITGRPAMPPRWMLGYMQSNYGYRNWAEVNQAAQHLRAAGFPLDALFLDLQWFGGVPGVHDQFGNVRPEFNLCRLRRVGSFNWFKNEFFDFSNPRENLSRLNASGVHIVPIEEGYFDVCNDGKNTGDNRNFAEASEQGFLAKRDFNDRQPALFANGDDSRDMNFGEIGYFGQVGMIDTSNPAARAWFWSKHLPLLKDGASAFWTDLGEPERFRWWWKYDGGLWHQDIHNVWDLNRARALYEGSLQDLPARRPFILSRSGYAGSQRYGVGIWSADTPARLKWAAAQPSAHLNLSMSGIPYTTSDIGGFGGFPVSTGEQFTRWMQMESFSSLTRAHGNTSSGANEQRIVDPSRFPDPYRSILRTYILWRESLVPYIYSLAREAYDTGMPLLRALPLVWPRDPNVADLGSEYLLGPSILVAPVLLGNDNHPDELRDVYLPLGKWIDLHDGTEYDGGRWLRRFPAPLAKMPLFAKAGAILPKGPNSPSVVDARWPLSRTFEVYPSDEGGRFMLYDDEGDGNGYRANQFARTEITTEGTGSEVRVHVSRMNGDYAGKPLQRRYDLELHAMAAATNVEFDGQPVAFTWDAAHRKIKVDGTPVATDVEHDWVIHSR